MIKLVQNTVSADGFPHVRWDQQVPTGGSLHSAEQWMALKIAVVAMIFTFTAIYAGSGDAFGAALAALAIGGMMLAGDKMLKGGITVWDVHIPGPREPSPGTLEAERRARATALLAKEHGEALVLPHGETKELYFWVFRGPEPGSQMKCVAGVPLGSVQSFELGTAEEWFGDLAQAELRRLNSAPNSYVIVAPTLGHDVVLVAESGGAKAQIAALHGLLTRRFVVEAPEMQARWKQKLEEEGEPQRRGGAG